MAAPPLHSHSTVPAQAQQHGRPAAGWSPRVRTHRRALATKTHAIERRRLGRTDLEVSSICFGALAFMHGWGGCVQGRIPLCVHVLLQAPCSLGSPLTTQRLPGSWTWQQSKVNHTLACTQSCLIQPTHPTPCTYTVSIRRRSSHCSHMHLHNMPAGAAFFDSAEMYPVPQCADTQGASERMLGRWMRSGSRNRCGYNTTTPPPPNHTQCTYKTSGVTSSCCLFNYCMQSCMRIHPT